MKSIRNLLLPAILGITFLAFMYWITIIGIASEQMKKGNDYGMDALIQQSKELLIYLKTGVDDHTISDHIRSISADWYAKSDKTIKLIPKWSRP